MTSNLEGVLLSRRGLSPVMVGRRAELARLARLVSEPVPPATVEPRVAMISGEAGVGKTRLVRELVAGLPTGVSLFAGQASRDVIGRPFELLLEAVEPTVSTWTEIPAALAGRADVLGVLLGPVAPALAQPSDREYYQPELLRAAVDLMRYLAGEGSAVMVFEDLHWADAESVAVFGRLGTTPSLPLVLIGTFRPETLSRRHPLAELLDTLERQQEIT